MPQFVADIEKQLGSEYWTNRYIILTSQLSTAQLFAAGGLLQFERELHSQLVTFTKVRVRTAETDDEAYTITQINLQGLRAVTDLLPLFNTLRVDINAATGRPSRKFFRGVLGEGDINGSAIVTNFDSYLTALEALFSLPEPEGGLVDPQQQLFTAAVAYPFVQMRQLRRASKRRNTPVFP